MTVNLRFFAINVAHGNKKKEIWSKNIRHVSSDRWLKIKTFLNLASSVHTHGPVDGSLYATILKSPKSLQTSPVKPLRTSTQSLISPPAEFSSNQHAKFDTPDSAKFHTLSTSTPQVHSYGKTEAGHYEDIKAIERSSARNTPTPSVMSYSSRPRTSNGYNGHASNGNDYATVGQAQNQGSGEQQREFVRSPLTLSMDSGISSSGVVNRGGRGVQGGASSVSPVSFPSQASPQGKLCKLGHPK